MGAVEVGATLGGRYRLLAKLGEGGMGAVWRAEHLELRTPVAVKLLRPDLTSDAEGLARFRREAQAAAALRGANVVQILDYGIEGREPYIVMELLEGEDLGARLDRHRRLPLADVTQILSDAGKAIARAHELGIVHRDLKPENVFLAREGDDQVVKVLDFGIAKSRGAVAADAAVQTGTGAMLGTPYYMCPEQLMGERSVDHRADVWALAVIAFECLTGVRPFEAETMAGLVVKICTREPPVPSHVAPVPAGFDEWFARGTARDPAGRFASVREQMAALRALDPSTTADTSGAHRASAAFAATARGDSTDGGSRSPSPSAGTPTTPAGSSPDATDATTAPPVPVRTQVLAEGPPLADAPTVRGQSIPAPSRLARADDPQAITASTASRTLRGAPATGEAARGRRPWAMLAVGAMALAGALAVGFAAWPRAPLSPAPGSVGDPGSTPSAGERDVQPSASSFGAASTPPVPSTAAAPASPPAPSATDSERAPVGAPSSDSAAARPPRAGSTARSAPATPSSTATTAPARPPPPRSARDRVGF